MVIRKVVSVQHSQGDHVALTALVRKDEKQTYCTRHFSTDDPKLHRVFNQLATACMMGRAYCTPWYTLFGYDVYYHPIERIPSNQ